MRSKDKQALMTTLIDSLSIMFPSENFVKTNVNTDLGFIIGKFLIFNFQSTFFFMEYLSWNLLLCKQLFLMINNICSTKC